jgi:hypothetical protein
MPVASIITVPAGRSPTVAVEPDADLIEVVLIAGLSPQATTRTANNSAARLMSL